MPGYNRNNLMWLFFSIQRRSKWNVSDQIDGNEWHESRDDTEKLLFELISGFVSSYLFVLEGERRMKVFLISAPKSSRIEWRQVYPSNSKYNSLPSSAMASLPFSPIILLRYSVISMARNAVNIFLGSAGARKNDSTMKDPKYERGKFLVGN